MIGLVPIRWKAGCVDMIEAAIAKEVAKEVAEVAKTAVSEVGKLPDKLGGQSEVRGLADKIGRVENSREKGFGSEIQKEKIIEQEVNISEVENGKRSLETTAEKGNYGEMKTDQDLRKRDYVRISKDIITNIDQEGHQGIDGVYYNPEGKPPYVIVDAKYGSAQLGDTIDGKQMSQGWIDKRLDSSVGKEMADKIRMEQLLNSDNVGKYVAHVDSFGNVTYDRLDIKANVVERGVNIGA